MLYVSGNPLDINTWVLEWMTEHHHYTITVPEAIVILELPQCTSPTACSYGSQILRDDLMKMLMKPQAPEAPACTKFPVSELLYLPSTLYRILARPSALLKAINPLLKISLAS